MTSVKEPIGADDADRAAKSIQVTRHTIRRRGELLFPKAGELRAARRHHCDVVINEAHVQRFVSALLLLLGTPINRAFLLTLPRATNIP